MRRRMSRGVDRRIFRRTGGTTKAINLSTRAMRGGVRL